MFLGLLGRKSVKIMAMYSKKLVLNSIFTYMGGQGNLYLQSTHNQLYDRPYQLWLHAELTTTDDACSHFHHFHLDNL